MPNLDTAQMEILFDPAAYSAFPSVVRLEGEELLIAFRQAPATPIIHHTHMRSVITVARSYDLGRSWDIASAAQMAAGGGQELGLIYLGHGRVGGALAWHEVAPMREQKRMGIDKLVGSEFPFRTPGTYFAWSDTWGLTWPPHFISFVGPDSMPCAAPIRLADGALLCPAYTFDGSDTGMDSIYYLSRDGGRSWSPQLTIAARQPGVRGFCEPCVLELAPGHWLALHRIETPKWGPERTFWANVTRDGGKTWNSPRDTGILSGACPRLMRAGDGRVVLTFGRRFEPCGIYAAFSDNHGDTWSPPSLLRACYNSDQGYSSTVQLDDRRMLTVCYAQNASGTTGIVGTFWNLPQA